MAKLDERGSALQHLIYNLACKAYAPYDVVYEYPIGDLKQRIDIFIPLLGIAIEVDGVQHYQYSKFFFKDESAWNYSVYLDDAKDKYLYNHGVKLIRIPYFTKIKTAEELKELISSVEYPPVEYTEIEKETSAQKVFKLKQKEAREQYKKKQKELKNKKKF